MNDAPPATRPDPTLDLKNVVVEFPIYAHDKLAALKFLSSRIGGNITQAHAGQPISVRALDDISVTLAHGDRLGLVGHNGAGKSTLLRVMAGIYKPIGGTVKLRGKISPLFDISLGLAFDDTGMENIANIGMYLGLTPKQLKEKTPEVAEFTELGDFLHLPVRTYSQGMMTRLSFAIATCVEPEILLLDEGLSAGDARFADKVRQRVDALVARSAIMVFASHSDTMIKTMCNRAMLLEKGRIVASGGVDEVLDKYRELNAKALENRSAGA